MRQEQVWDCVLISPTGNRTWSVQPAQACPMGKGGTLPEENMLENYLSCCTILGAHNLSWSSYTKEMFVSLMLSCKKGAVPFTE